MPNLFESLENSKHNIKNYEKNKDIFFNIIPNITEDAADLLGKILIWDPKKRLNISEILEHNYFKEIRERKFYEKLGLGKRYTMGKKIITSISPKYRMNKHYESPNSKNNKQKLNENKSDNKNCVENYILNTNNTNKSTKTILNDSVKNSNINFLKKGEKIKKIELQNNYGNLNTEIKCESSKYSHKTNNNNEKELDIEELKQNFLIQTENFPSSSKSPTNILFNSNKKIYGILNNEKINTLNKKENNLKNFKKIITNKENKDNKIGLKMNDVIKKENINNIPLNNINKNNKKKFKIGVDNLFQELKDNYEDKNDKNFNSKEDPNKLSNFTESENKTYFEKFLEMGSPNFSPIKKKNLYNINIANTKSPRYIPIIVNRPVEAFKGNFLNDFHKNTVKFNSNDKRIYNNNTGSTKYLESSKNSAASPRNNEMNNNSNNNLITFNTEDNKFKFPDQLPILVPPFYINTNTSDLHFVKNISEELSTKNIDGTSKNNQGKNIYLILRNIY